MGSTIELDVACSDLGAGVQGTPHSASGEEEDGHAGSGLQPRLMSVALPFREVAEDTESWPLVETQGRFL